MAIGGAPLGCAALLERSWRSYAQAAAVLPRASCRAGRCRQSRTWPCLLTGAAMAATGSPWCPRCARRRDSDTPSRR